MKVAAGAVWQRSSEAVLLLVGAAGIAAWLAIAFVHHDDRYRLGHVQGHWMALAQYANAGTLYPPLFDGVRYGGTRHMPLPILLNALAARATGEYLVSGKAVAGGLFATLLVLVVLTLRRLRCRWPIAVALCGLIPATNTGVLVGSTPGGDVLPVVLQMSALLLITAAVGGRATSLAMAAGALAGLAAASKLTGVWAALSIASWLASRRAWRQAGWFVTVFGVTVAVALGTVQWASQGRFMTTLLTLTFAGGTGSVGWARAPSQLAFFGIGDAIAVWMIVPFALVAVVDAWRHGGATVHHHALGWSVLLVLVVFTDVGAGLNQLLDPAVLTVIAVGGLAHHVDSGRRDPAALATVLVLSLAWSGASGVRGLVPDLREVVAMVRTGETPPQYDPRGVADAVGRNTTLLTEDPGLPVLLGQAPVVLDAFMLRRLDQVLPEDVDVLIARIDRGEFDRVALIMPLQGEETWWRDYHFGPRVVAALRAKYELVGQRDRYFVYRPRGG